MMLWIGGALVVGGIVITGGTGAAFLTSVAEDPTLWVHAGFILGPGIGMMAAGGYEVSQNG
jgi:hypothetical protein